MQRPQCRVLPVFDHHALSNIVMSMRGAHVITTSWDAHFLLPSARLLKPSGFARGSEPWNPIAYDVVHGAVCVYAAGLEVADRSPQDRAAASESLVGTSAGGWGGLLHARRGVRRVRLFEAPDDVAAAAVALRTLWGTCGATACSGCCRPTRCGRRLRRRPRRRTLRRSQQLSQAKPQSLISDVRSPHHPEGVCN